MSKYKRMTERDEWGNADIIGVDSGNLQGNLMGDEFNRVTLALNRLADLEDKIESGKLVKLPCKVGDNIFHCNYDPVISNWVIKKEIVAEFDVFFYANLIVQRQAFITEQQAEARLKELKGE